MEEVRTCSNCGQRPGVVIWSEGSVAFVHGAYAMWCKICAITAQLEHAMARAAAIPVLKEKLLKLAAGEDVEV